MDNKFEILNIEVKSSKLEVVEIVAEKTDMLIVRRNGVLEYWKKQTVNLWQRG
jgi:hypothetical protein